jgi:hypothetical protein
VLKNRIAAEIEEALVALAVQAERWARARSMASRLLRASPPSSWRSSVEPPPTEKSCAPLRTPGVAQAAEKASYRNESPRSISFRMASESDSFSGCVAAQSSMAFLFSGDRRSPTIGCLPVAGRPRPRFFGLADIDCFMILV